MSRSLPRVCIKGFDKPALLQALVDNANFMGGQHGGIVQILARMQAPLSRADAEAALAHDNGYVDYCTGRSIKVDFSKDEVDPSLYDRDNGEGAFKKVVDGMRAK